MGEWSDEDVAWAIDAALMGAKWFNITDIIHTMDLDEAEAADMTMLLQSWAASIDAPVNIKEKLNSAGDPMWRKDG